MFVGSVSKSKQGRESQITVQDLEMRTVILPYGRKLRNVCLFSACIQHLNKNICEGHQQYSSPLMLLLHVGEFLTLPRSSVFGTASVLDLCDDIGLPTIAYLQIAKHRRHMATFRDNALDNDFDNESH